jgi:hypothetical protein
MLLQKQFTLLVQEIYKAGSVPIVSRSLVSLYAEVAESGGDVSKLDLRRVSDADHRVDTNQLWTGQIRGKKSYFIKSRFELIRIQTRPNQRRPKNPRPV